MNMKLVLFLLGSLLGAVAAESIRETELMAPNGMMDGLIEGSGADDEDMYPDYYDEDSESLDETSGDFSGDSDDAEDDDDENEDYLESTEDTPVVDSTTWDLGNDIEEGEVRKPILNNEVVQVDNDIAISRNLIPEELEPSNSIPLAVSSNDFFSRTEVVIAVVAGGLVGLVFAIVIVLLVMRVRKNKKGDIAYDTVKKPIYKKAPTIEA